MYPKINAGRVLTGLSCGVLVLVSACGGEAAQSGNITPAQTQPSAAQNNQSAVSSEPIENKLSVYTYKIVNTFAHDEGAFTQGLFFHNGQMYESTGLNGLSSLRKVDLESGDVLAIKELPSALFGEGSVGVDDKIISLTWRAGKGLVHNIDDFSPESEFSYDGEGWGLTFDGDRLIMSDGTSQLRFLDPETYAQTGSLQVTLQGRPIHKINELEWVSGQDGKAGLIYANLWQEDWIAMIDPVTGRVRGLIDMSKILPEADVIRMRNITRQENVLNGIAWDEEGERLFVTGKNWPKLFEVELVLREER